jgi:SAM-dependent methyltransferase
MDKKVFEAYSQYYDLLYKDKNYTEETKYVDSLITQFCSQTKSILELGCGTGIHALQLAEKGYKVEGIDLSETMLHRALERQSESPIAISERLSFLEGDIRTYESALKFDTVISLFHVISYMTTNEDLNQAFTTVKKHLKPHGIFIFDCWHGPGVLNDKPVSRTKSFENELVSIKRNSVPHFMSEKNIVDVNFDIHIHNKKTNEDIKLKETHSMRYLFTDELKSLLEINGLEIIHAEEWLTKTTLSENSWNACYVCRNKF